MTVNTTKITAGPYNGNDLADTFSYGFTVTDKTELKVYETDDEGVQTLLTVDTDYTVNIGESAGGTITRLAGALPTNYQWYIRSSFDATQDTSFGSQGAFFPEIHEQAMDKLTFLIQQILDTQSRTPVISAAYSGPLNITMDDPKSGQFMRWTTDLTGLENVVLDIDGLNQSIINANESADEADAAVVRVDDAIALLDGNAIPDLKAAALAAGTTYDNITYSTNLVNEIKGYIFNAERQITYAVPESAQGKFISIVVDGVLTTTDTSEYELVNINEAIVNYGSSTYPSQLDKVTLLSETLLDESIVGKLQGFEYDEYSNRCFLVSYLETGNAYPEDEATTIAEYLTDDNGAITSLVACEYDVAFGHGEALLIDTSEDGKTYLWISTSSDGTGTSAIRRYEWNNGIVGSAVDFAHDHTLFSWADEQNKNVMMLVDGQNHYISFDKFKLGDFTPYKVESRAPLEDKHVIALGNQSFKKRYGEFYGLNGFDMGQADEGDSWKSSCYLSAGNNVLRLIYVSDLSPLSGIIEPENIGWKRKANGDLVTVIACKSPDAVRLFQCSANTGNANSENLSDGLFKKRINSESPISRNTVYSESKNPLATMLLYIGEGFTGAGQGDDFNNFYMTQEGNSGSTWTAAINHHQKGKLSFHSDLHNSGDWAHSSVGFDYSIVSSDDRGDLDEHPIMVTKDNVLIGESNNAIRDYTSLSVRNRNGGSSYYAFGGSVSYLGADYASFTNILNISLFDVTTKVRNRIYGASDESFFPYSDGDKSLGTSTLGFSKTHTKTLEMKSPNGTKYTVSVSDTGEIVVVAV